MGDPKKIRRKFDKPSHPWQKARIESEKLVIEEYGLQNKKDLWRMETVLRRFKNQVKSLASRSDEQSKLEEKQLVDRLVSLGLIKHDETLDAVLGLETKNVMERRLQTLLVRKRLARSMVQARQFITHGHIRVDGKKITFPSYLVSIKEESLIEFNPMSTLSKDDHPERAIVETQKEKADRKKREAKEEALPVFDQKEIEAIEETGAIIKKEAKAEAVAEKNKEEKKEKAAKPEHPKSGHRKEKE
ncbi:30S ribosomal protein S4 [Candidatus Woesearchaeota archaeon]|nr:30S ribosomal protein S4 [Candidatus Woesearchaeota archaeon]